MAVIIGSARHDENGHITGGKAGDQTGKEVATENWYLAKQGWRCFRAKDPEKAKKIAWDMKAACNNNHIGYDQSQNQTLFHAVQSLGWDCSKVQTDCETDCSQLVRVCVLYAGIPIGMFSTADEPQYLLGTGQFKEMTGAAYTTNSSGLRAGDILCTRVKGHTVVVLSDGAGPLTVDGWWGKDTTKATQKFLGLSQSGEILKQYRGNKKLCPNATGGWQWKLVGWKGGDATIKALQSYLGAGADGLWGKLSIMRMQTFLMEKGYVISSTELAKPTMGVTTVKAWQQYLNKQAY